MTYNSLVDSKVPVIVLVDHMNEKALLAPSTPRLAPKVVRKNTLVAPNRTKMKCNLVQLTRRLIFKYVLNFKQSLMTSFCVVSTLSYYAFVI